MQVNLQWRYFNLQWGQPNLQWRQLNLQWLQLNLQWAPVIYPATFMVKDSSMAMLYANKIAWGYAHSFNDKKYPPGAVLYQVTWKQKADSVWFGARIPKEIQSVERISYTYNGPARYELYEGRPLRKSSALPDTGRIASIIEQKETLSP